MSLPKYIINFDEFVELFKGDILSIVRPVIDSNYPQLNTNNIEAMLDDIKRMLPYEHYRGLRNRIDLIVYGSIDGVQKIDGRLLDIPPIIKDNIEIFQFDKDIYITGLSINQTGWKNNDRYSLETDKTKLIYNATTKELGEHKYLNTFFKVNAQTPIKFTLSNNSGNSRQTTIDLEYLESIDVTPTPIPNEPTVDDIRNDWDIAVVLDWESNSLADLDLHGFIDDKHVYFAHREDDNFYLNFDNTSHTTNTNPEIISVKGYMGHTLKIYVNDYNGIDLINPINIKIYHKTVTGKTILRVFNITLDSDRNYLNGICAINLSSLNITELDDRIRTMNGGI
jgi:hypothetical protein